MAEQDEDRSNALESKQDWTSQSSNPGARFAPKIVPRKIKHPSAAPKSKPERKPKPRSGAHKGIEMTASGPFSMGPAKSATAHGSFARVIDIPYEKEAKSHEKNKRENNNAKKELGLGIAEKHNSSSTSGTCSDMSTEDLCEHKTCGNICEGVWDPDILTSNSSESSKLSWEDELLLIRIPPGVFQDENPAICGELKVYKSGKKVMHLGDSKLELMQTSRKSHYRHAALVSRDTLEYAYLGDVQNEYAGILDL